MKVLGICGRQDKDRGVMGTSSQILFGKVLLVFCNLSHVHSPLLLNTFTDFILYRNKRNVSVFMISLPALGTPCGFQRWSKWYYKNLNIFGRFPQRPIDVAVGHCIIMPRLSSGCISGLLGSVDPNPIANSEMRRSCC